MICHAEAVHEAASFFDWKEVGDGILKKMLIGSWISSPLYMLFQACNWYEKS